MSISINCSIDLTEEELLFILRRRAGQIIIVSPPEETKAPDAPTPNVTFNSPTDYANSPEPEVIPEERIEAVETVIAAALPPKPTRRAKVNGAEAPINSTPLAPSPPPPEPLEEAAMRSLLSKVGAVHPLKVKAITNILEAHGGARRLSECDPSTWPAIATAANATLVEYSI